MSLKDIFLYIISLIFGLIIFRSFFVGMLLQTILFMVLPVIIASISLKFSYNKILYITEVIIILFLLTIFNFNPNDGLNYLLPLSGGLIVTLLYISTWEKMVLVSKSTNLIKEYKTEESLPYLEKILDLDPNSFFALYNKSATLNQMENYEESLELSDIMLEKMPKNVLALNTKAHNLIKLKRYDEALEILDEALKKDSKNEITLGNKALALAGQGKYQEAINYYEDTLERTSSKEKWKFFNGMFLKTVLPPKQLAEIWFEKGKAHQKLQQYEEALECFNKALELDSDSEDALNSKNNVMQLLGK